MSTHSFLSTRQRSNNRADFSRRRSLGIVSACLALIIVLFSYSTASARVAAASALDKQPEHVARAGVSVVRVVSLYQLTDTSELLVCNGLGSLVASGEGAGAANPAQAVTNVVLTDGSLVNPKNATCRESFPFENAQLLSVKVIMSSFFFEPREQEKPFLVEGLDARAIQCLNTTDCAQGPALLTFTTPKNALFPYLDTTKDGEAQANVTLRNALEISTVLAGPQTFPNQQGVDTFMLNVNGFITPTSALLTSGQVTPGNEEAKFEPGTPTVDKTGRLVQIHLSRNPLGSVRSTELAILLSEQIKQLSPNPVHENWQNGVTEFYQGGASTGENQKALYKKAEESFKKASEGNADFRGAQAFQQIAVEAGAPRDVGVPQSTATPQPTQTTTDQGQQNILSQNWMGFPLLAWLIGGVLAILVLLLVVTSLTYGKARAKRKRTLKEELEEAERRANVDAQHIAEQEAAQNKAGQAAPVWSQQTVPMQYGSAAPGTAAIAPAPDVRGNSPLPASAPPPAARKSGALYCPQCGEPVDRDVNYCPNCRLFLSLSDTGHRLRIPPMPTSPGTPSQPLESQPTLEMATGKVANGKLDPDKTLPYNKQATPSSSGKKGPLGLVVGASSDRGIKRQHKPNEDSLFAAFGARNVDSSLQQIGLFVVADGMGGHANGQEASRRAIQTIINYMLPKVMKDTTLQGEALGQLLIEGVQHANKAVHQNNVELRADMGTTMTATLVVDDTAYVTNVGDSRTYLYREPEGLSKVTQDHSVVMSLVEAGIIKIDDIYTHPKRNQIYRSLGEKPSVDVDLFTVSLQHGDKLVMCSDGLWDMVRDPKIQDVIRSKNGDPDVTAQSLIQAALEGGGEDNVTVVVVSALATVPRANEPGMRLIAKPETTQMPAI